jgi:hypothetical protein
MAEPFDVYADAFLITVTPLGANMSFEVREAHPSAQRVQTTTRLGTVRTSIEHLKLMAVMIVRQIKIIEEQGGVKYPVPTNILAQIQIAPEDWDVFWGPAS